MTPNPSLPSPLTTPSPPLAEAPSNPSSNDSSLIFGLSFGILLPLSLALTCLSIYLWKLCHQRRRSSDEGNERQPEWAEISRSSSSEDNDDDEGPNTPPQQAGEREEREEWEGGIRVVAEEGLEGERARDWQRQWIGMQDLMIGGWGERHPDWEEVAPMKVEIEDVEELARQLRENGIDG